MKNISALILLFIFLLGSIAQVAAEDVLGPNLVKNADFEFEITSNDWIIHILEETGCTISLDATTFVSGSKSLCFDGDLTSPSKNYMGRVYQVFAVEEGEKYEIDVFLKKELISGTEANIYIGVFFFTQETLGASEYNGGNYNSLPVITTGTTEFDKYSCSATIPNKVNPEDDPVIRLLLGVYVAPKKGENYRGKVWVDNVSMRRVYSEPLVPPTVQATRLANGKVQLNWQVEENTEGVQPTQFDVYRSTTSSMEGGIKVGENIEGTTWTDESLSQENKGRYYYWLKAYDVMERSVESAVAEALGLASLSGVVSTDNARSPAGTVLTVFKQDESITQTTLGEDGNFSITLVEGTYQLSLQKANYKLLRSEDIVLQAEAVVNQSFQLEYSVVKPNPPQNVTATTPNPGLVLLSWGAPTEGETVDYYRIYRQEGNVPDFDAAVPIVFRETTTSYPDTSVQGGQTYIYFVVSISLAEIPSDPAESNSVTVGNPPLVQLIKPIEGEVLIDTKPFFEWGQLANVAKYTLELSKDEYFSQGNVIKVENLEINTHELLVNLDEGTWYWRVQPSFTTGVVGSFGEPETFVMVISNPGLGGAGMVMLDQQHFAPRKGEVVLGRYVLDKDSEASLKLYSTNGKCVRILLESEHKESGNHPFQWDGKNQQGEYVPNGLYFIELFVKAAGTKPVRAVGRVLVLN